MAGLLASQGNLDYEMVVTHFMRVNGCSREDFQRHYDAAFARWRERSRYEWQTDLGDFTPPVTTDATEPAP